MRHIGNIRTPLIVSYGTDETPEFQHQARDFAAAVKTAGKPVELLVADDEILGRGYLRKHGRRLEK